MQRSPASILENLTTASESTKALYSESDVLLERE